MLWKRGWLAQDNERSGETATSSLPAGGFERAACQKAMQQRSPESCRWVVNVCTRSVAPCTETRLRVRPVKASQQGHAPMASGDPSGSLCRSPESECRRTDDVHLSSGVRLPGPGTLSHSRWMNMRVIPPGWFMSTPAVKISSTLKQFWHVWRLLRQRMVEGFEPRLTRSSQSTDAGPP